MSELTEFLNEDIKPLCDTFFKNHAKEYNLTTNEGCGEYTEALVENLRTLGYSKVGHLKKNPGQTQYNGHANDAFLYRQGDPTLYRAVDVIGAAESTDPNNPPRPNFGIDEPRYTDAYWLAEPADNGGGQPPVPQPCPFPSYAELGDDAFWREIGKMIQSDYTEAHQSLNDGSFVWSSQTMYDAMYYIVVEKMPPVDARQRSVNKHRPEWRKALGLPA